MAAGELDTLSGGGGIVIFILTDNFKANNTSLDNTDLIPWGLKRLCTKRALLIRCLRFHYTERNKYFLNFFNIFKGVLKSLPLSELYTSSSLRAADCKLAR